MIKRYDMKSEYNGTACEDQVKFTECADGSWVKHDAAAALKAERDALATRVEHLKFVCKNMYEQYEWAMQTQMFNKTSAMAREIIDKPPHECLAAHDAEVAKVAFIAGCIAFGGIGFANVVDDEVEKYAAQLRAKAGE